ncbi:hypothetical protein KCP75_26100 [Salmonella enterica subsp. enterica]|nr:hypothetical protein KCP75_26100 [Salmonella enterica subsp. enterica]
MVPPLPPCWFCTVFLLHGAEGVRIDSRTQFPLHGFRWAVPLQPIRSVKVYFVPADCRQPYTYNQNGLRMCLPEERYLDNRFRAGAIDVMFK